LEESTVRKVAQTCDLEINDILAVHNVESTYHVPALLQYQGTIPLISGRLRLDDVTKTATQIEAGNTTWAKWTGLTMSKNQYEEVMIALVGKYVESMDAYMSVQKALEHAAMAHQRKLNLKIVNSARLELDAAGYSEAWATVHTADGIFVLGGFGP
jgi:CTP synthase